MLLILARGTLTPLQNLLVIGCLVDILGLLKGDFFSLPFFPPLFFFFRQSVEYGATKFLFALTVKA